MPSPTSGDADRVAWVARRLAALLFCVFMLAASREPPWGDAQVSYDTTRALVDRQELQIFSDVPAYFYTVHDGRRYGPAAIGNAVAHIPGYLAYKALRLIPGIPDAPLFALTSHLTSAALMAFACAVFYRLCRRRRAGETLAIVLTLTLGLATIGFCYARSPFSEALQTAALVLFVACVLDQSDAMTSRGMAGVGAAAGVLLNAKLAYAAVLPVAALFLVASAGRVNQRRLRRGSLAALAALAPFVALALAHNAIKTGSILHTGYDQPWDNFSGDLVPALYGFLLSSGKSVFAYSPPLVLGLIGLRSGWRYRRAETAFLLSVIGTMTLLHAKYFIWHGGYSWGPRYLVPLTPIVLLLALPWLADTTARGRHRLRRAALAATIAAGCAVQLLGSVFYWDHYVRVLVAVQEQTGGGAWSPDFLPAGYYVPQFSPIAGHWWLLRHVVAGDPNLDRDAPWKLLVRRPIDLSEPWARLRIDWWALDWFAGPPASRAAGTIVLALLGAAAVTGARSLIMVCGTARTADIPVSNQTG